MRTERVPRWWWVTLSALVVFALTLRNGFWWDDLILLEGNELLTRPGLWTRAFTADFWDSTIPSDIVHFYWRPIPKLSHYLLRGLSDGAWPFHLLNLTLHLATSSLVFEWLRRRLLAARGDVPDDVARRGALAGALVFAVHPSRFESVGWASCSTELFLGFFVVGGLLLLESKRGWPWSVVAFALAMMSKESAALVPLALVLDATVRGETAHRWRDAMVAGGSIAITLVLRATVNIEAPHVDDAATLPQRLVRVLGAWFAYHWRSVAPTQVTYFPADFEAIDKGVFEVPVFWWVGGLLLVVGWAALAVSAVRRPMLRPVLGDLMWWAVMISPVLLIVATPNPGFVSDRFLYLPLLGLSAAVGRAALWAWRRGLAPRQFWLATAGPLTASAMLIMTAIPSCRDELSWSARELSLHQQISTLERYTVALARRGLPYAETAVLEQTLAQPMSVERRVRFMMMLANARVSSLPDTAHDELDELRRFFQGLRGGELLTMRGLPVLHADPALVRQLGQGPGVIDSERNVEVRLGVLQPATDAARAQWRKRPWFGAAIDLARLLALGGQWGEAVELLQEAQRQFPPLKNSVVFQQVHAGASAAKGSDPLTTAIALSLVYERLESPRRAREVLEPFIGTQSDTPSFIDARVQAELSDKRFDRAAGLLMEAKSRRPQDPALNEGLAEVHRLEQLWKGELERQLAFTDPEMAW